MDNIATKIKALLAKAESTNNTNEAELFFAKAYELMGKHQIGFDALEDDKMDVSVEYERSGGAAPDWDFNLLITVARYFGAESVIWRRKGCYQLELIGRDSARITAVEMHAYLVRTVKRLGKENYHTMIEAKGPLTREQATRRIGNSLRIRLQELIEQRRTDDPVAGANDLLVMDQAEAFMLQLYPDIKPGKKSTLCTSEKAKALAGTIGLNLQATQRNTLRLT